VHTGSRRSAAISSSTAISSTRGWPEWRAGSTHLGDKSLRLAIQMNRLCGQTLPPRLRRVLIGPLAVAMAKQKVKKRVNYIYPAHFKPIIVLIKGREAGREIRACDGVICGPHPLTTILVNSGSATLSRHRYINLRRLVEAALHWSSLTTAASKSSSWTDLAAKAYPVPSSSARAAGRRNIFRPRADRAGSAAVFPAQG